jgi:aromatic-L-amino-acid/L-tryptophan decarboxylase
MPRDHIAWTTELANWIGAEPDFELTSLPSLALLSFRYRPPSVENPERLDRLNERLLQALNDGGRLYLIQNRLRGRCVIRFTIGQLYTTREDVRRTWEEARATARALPPLTAATQGGGLSGGIAGISR